MLIAKSGRGWVHYWIVVVPFLVHSLALSGLSKRSVLLKCKETFKLADLQLLEAQTQCEQWGGCERLVLDAATGSSLLRFDVDDDVLMEWGRDHHKVPSFVQRSDWVGFLVASGRDPLELIANVKDSQDMELQKWTLEYLRMREHAQNVEPKMSYTSRTLLACIAQALTSCAVLDPSEAQNRLIVADTEDALYLVCTLSIKRRILSIPWSSRPFQYSSAINPSAGEILIDVLLSMAKVHKGSPIKLLDPTCGSGTFLAFAAAKGAHVEGWDVNPRCVEGSQHNLDHALDKRDGVVVRRLDATTVNTLDSSVDCVVANLPWGRNSVAYRDEHFKILVSLATLAAPQTPCGFVTQDNEIHRHLQRAGFLVVAYASIPQEGFALPKGKKSFQNGQGTRCFITIATSPAEQT